MKNHLNETLFMDFISDNLSEERKKNVLSHLASCNRCRENLSFFIKISNPSIKNKENQIINEIFPQGKEDYSHQILPLLKRYYNEHKKLKWQKFPDLLNAIANNFMFILNSIFKQKRILISSSIILIALLLFLFNPIEIYMDYRAMVLIKAGNELMAKNIPPYYTLPLRAYGSFQWIEFQLIRGKTLKEIRNQSKIIKEYFEKALNLRKENTQVLSSTGNFYLVTGDLESARLLLKKALEIQPDNEIAANGMGIISFKEGKLDLAIQYFSTAKESNPNLLEARYNLAFLYEAAGKNQEAKTELLDYLKMDPSSKWADNVRRMLKNLQ